MKMKVMTCYQVITSQEAVSSFYSGWVLNASCILIRTPKVIIEIGTKNTLLQDSLPNVDFEFCTFMTSVCCRLEDFFKGEKNVNKTSFRGSSMEMHSYLISKLSLK